VVMRRSSLAADFDKTTWIEDKKEGIPSAGPSGSKSVGLGRQDSFRRVLRFPDKPSRIPSNLLALRLVQEASPFSPADGR